MHLPPPNLPRFGGGERPPIPCKPIAPLTITMGLRLTVFASPNTPRASLSVPTCPPIRAPFPHRERGWGERADTPVATLGAYLCAVRIEFRLPPKFNPYPALQAIGVLGQSPKRILPTFVRTKVGPRRAGVLTKAFYKTCATEGEYRLFHERPGGEPYKLSPCGDLSPPKAITSYITNIRRKAPPLGNTSPLLRIDRPAHFYYYGVGKTPERSI